MTVEIREFTQEGNNLFKSMMELLIKDPGDLSALKLLVRSSSNPLEFELDQYATPVGATMSWTGGITTAQIASALVSKFPLSQQTLASTFDRLGLWNWLAYSAICNRVVWNGSDDLLKLSSYCIEVDSPYNTYYRHIIRSRWFVRGVHGQYGDACLFSKPSVFSDVSEQILSRHYYCQSRSIVELVCRMLYDEKASSFQLKRRYTIGLRQLMADLDFLAVNYDVRAMPVDDLFRLLNDDLRLNWPLNPQIP